MRQLILANKTNERKLEKLGLPALEDQRANVDIMQCPSGLEYNHLTGTCDLTSSSRPCLDGKSKSCDLGEPFKAAGNSLAFPSCDCESCTKAHPADCSSFYFCTHLGVAHELRCPKGLKYNSAVGECDMPEVTSCPHQPTCSCDNCRYPSRDACDAFWQCTEGHAVRHSCGHGLLFNRDTSQCDLAINVVCSPTAWDEGSFTQHLCADRRQDCHHMAKHGGCSCKEGSCDFQTFVLSNCPKSCGTCDKEVKKLEAVGHVHHEKKSVHKEADADSSSSSSSSESKSKECIPRPEFSESWESFESWENCDKESASSESEESVEEEEKKELIEVAEGMKMKPLEVAKEHKAVHHAKTQGKTKAEEPEEDSSSSSSSSESSSKECIPRPEFSESWESFESWENCESSSSESEESEEEEKKKKSEVVGEKKAKLPEEVTQGQKTHNHVENRKKHKHEKEDSDSSSSSSSESKSKECIPRPEFSESWESFESWENCEDSSSEESEESEEGGSSGEGNEGEAEGGHNESGGATDGGSEGGNVDGGSEGGSVDGGETGTGGGSEGGNTDESGGNTGETETGTGGGSEGGNVDGSETGTDGGSETGTDGGSETGTDGGSEGGNVDGSEGNTDGGSEGGNVDGSETGTDGGSEGGNVNGSETGTDGGSEGGNVDGSETGTDGGSEGGNVDGSETGTDGGSEGGNIDGSEGNTDGGSEGGSVDGSETGTDGGSEGGSVDGSETGTDGGSEGGSVDGSESGTDGGSEGGNVDGSEGGNVDGSEGANVDVPDGGNPEENTGDGTEEGTEEVPVFEGCAIECTVVGQMLAHTSDCHKFIHCSPGGPVEKSCPPGTVWDQGHLTCNHEWAIACVVGNYQSPDGKACGGENGDGNFEKAALCQQFKCPSENGLFPHPHDCNKWISCRANVPEVKSCPPHLYYNPAVHACDWHKNVQCTPAASTSCVVPNPEVPSHEHNPKPKVCDCEGCLRSHPEDCNAYYYCGSDSDATFHTCSNDLVFDPTISQCVHRSEFPKCHREPSPKCEELTDESRYPSHLCSQYFQCENGRAMKQECPGKELFDISLGKCENPVLVRCGQRKGGIIPHIHSSNVIKAAEDCRHLDGIYGMSGSHKNYFLCSEGKAIIMKCPKYAMFSPKFKKCLSMK
ncbi:uncharacterized protein LOC143033688 [Oratosquilla oratoria]|uniref:uncharacterized protein LOC143033688 n=1 Tax=Oratosquilla oratoria TaxID=337810 RepID=UPI003F76BBE3